MLLHGPLMQPCYDVQHQLLFLLHVLYAFIPMLLTQCCLNVTHRYAIVCWFPNVRCYMVHINHVSSTWSHTAAGCFGISYAADSCANVCTLCHTLVYQQLNCRSAATSVRHHCVLIAVDAARIGRRCYKSL